MRFFTIISIFLLSLLGFLALYNGIKLKKMLSGLGKTSLRAIYFWLPYLLLIVVIFYHQGIGLIYLLYWGLFNLLFDFLQLVFNGGFKLIGPKEKKTWLTKCEQVLQTGVIPLLLSAGFILLAYHNATQIVGKSYELTLPAPDTMSHIQELKLIYISDFHTGTSIHREQLEKIRNEALAFQPDIMLLGGDVFDERSTERDKADFYELFGNLDLPLGTYYIHGNHDRREDVKQGMEATGIKVLADDAVFLQDSFYLVGRKDSSMRPRKSLEDLLGGLQQEYPILLLDHRPLELISASELGIDLQISGHTHAGQLFPLNLFIGQFNELGYGYQQVGSGQVLVSSGVGTWRFPLRLGSNSEYLQITLRFLPATATEAPIK